MIRKMIFGVLNFICGIGIILTYLFGIAIHLFTVLFAYQHYGFIPAAATMIFPGPAEVCWFAIFWINSGTPFNSYGMTVFSFLFWLAIFYGATFVTVYFQEGREAI